MILIGYLVFNSNPPFVHQGAKIIKETINKSIDLTLEDK